MKLLSLAAVLTAFGAGPVQAQDQTLVFTPQWMAQAQFAGYYVAEEKGFYKEAGVDVRIEHPSATQSAMSQLSKKNCQAITLQLCQAMEMVDGGLPLVNILQTSMNNGGHSVGPGQGSSHPERRKGGHMECGLRPAGHLHEHKGEPGLRMDPLCSEH